MAMDQYLLIPFLVGWTFIYQLFWCSPGVQGFDTLPDVYCIETERQGKHLETEQCGTHSQCWIPFLLPNLLVILVLQLKFNSRSKSFSCVHNFFKLQKSLHVFTTKFQSPLFFGGELVQFPLQSPPHFTRHPLNGPRNPTREWMWCPVWCPHLAFIDWGSKNAGKINDRTYGWSPWKKMKLKIWENHGQSTVSRIFPAIFLFRG